MKNYQRTLFALRPLSALALAAGLALPLASLAASVVLATSPLATSTTSSVLPNVMFVLDNSGSMDWEHMPDDNSDNGSDVPFQYGYYGLRSSQCNQVYYDPNNTYLPPVDSSGAAYADASFTSALKNGYDSASTAVNLNTSFKASTDLNPDTLGQPAYYYTYSGTLLSGLQKDYNSNTNAFYTECHDSTGGNVAATAPVNGVKSLTGGTPSPAGTGVFNKHKLSTTETANITISGTGGNVAASASVTGITVNGLQIMPAASATVASITNTAMATNIATQINLCTAAITGNCTVTGYSAAASSGIVTITGPTSAADYIPVISTSGSMGSITLAAGVFPFTDAAKLTNFANWYSFYRTRLLMMKTAAGRAFKTLDSHYRVGFSKISSSSTPTVYMGTFTSTQRSNWYTALYGAATSGSTPLREALANTGRYYAGKLSGADPVQYSCQQNFTILSTDGFWNGNAGFKVDGSTAVGNQDGTADRPMFDGSLKTQTDTQVRESKTQTTQQTSSLMGTLSKVLMRCNNTSAICGTASLTNSNWSVVTSGSCSVTSSTQCSPVTGLSGSSAVATKCNTGASITSTSLPYTLTITVTGVSSSTRLDSIKIDGIQILTGTTSSSSNNSNNKVAANIGAKIGNGYSSSVSNNVITITKSGTLTAASTLTSYNVSSGGPATLTGAISGGVTYTLNNADSNGKIYSSCSYSSWSTPAVLTDSCPTGQPRSNTPNNTTQATAYQCNTTTYQGQTLVASCTPGNSGSPDFIETACSTSTVVTNNVTTCNAAPATSANGYTMTTCAAGNGGTSDTLADVAMYYYQTDLRTGTLNNCSGALGGTIDVCANDVFKTDSDSNTAQHMSTFTLGMGASGRMRYSPSYLNDTSGDYYSVWKGLTARPTAANNLISVNGTSPTLVSSIKVNGVELMSGATTTDTLSSSLATKIAAKITQNGYSASATGSAVTITPTPASAPVITQSGEMILTVGPVCAWQSDSSTCNWPVPGDGLMENIDDLWHAAVDGHGVYFSATSPASLSTGLSNALAAIAARKGSSAAAATSTLNPVPGNNYAYVASYTTVKWQGNLEARTIDVNTGNVSEAATWCVENIAAGICKSPDTVVADTSSGSFAFNCVAAGSTLATCDAPGVFDPSTDECKTPMAIGCTGTMPGKIGTSSDTRTIYTANNAGTALISFGSGTVPADNAAYAAAHSTNFDAAHIGTLSQWASLTSTQKSDAAGANLVSFLRGQTGYENRASNLSGATDNRLYRYREATLGDALESQPIFISKPVFSYVDPGYSDFAALYADRVGTVYMGANDGMLHAFSALDEGTSPTIKGGTERWAYVPSMVIPNMWKLADFDYSNLHTNFVNGSPIVSDVCPKDPPATCSGSEWKTILVGGLNGGGRGYYALDVTNPAAPVLLWEFTTTSGQGSTRDDAIGYSFGTPVITAKSDGTWVVLVTSGYNNTSPGNGQGYLYVLNAGTGAIISKIATGAGDTTTPSGLAAISAWNDASASNRVSYVYGGDLLGNVWRFDINSNVTAAIGTGDVVNFAILRDPAGNRQPVTTAPVLGKIGGKRIIFVSTGKYLETSDLTNTQQQTVYALKDDNSTYSNPAGSPRNSLTLVQQTLTETVGKRTVSSNPVNFSTGAGWYVDFPDAGERSNIGSKLIEGVLLIATIVPSNSVCSPGGYGWLNFFDYNSGGPVDSTGTASVRYNDSIVGINVLYINGAPVIETVTSNNPTPTVDPNVPIPPTKTGFIGKRVLWRELNP